MTILDVSTFAELSIGDVYIRFRDSAYEAQISREKMVLIFLEALRGDAVYRKLVEETCGVEFA